MFLWGLIDHESGLLRGYSHFHDDHSFRDFLLESDDSEWKAL